MREGDAQALRKVLAGEQEAYRVLVQQYERSAVQWAMGYVRETDLAQEVVQEAFVEAYFRLDTLRQPDRFGGWLRGWIFRWRRLKACCTGRGRIYGRRSSIMADKEQHMISETQSETSDNVMGQIGSLQRDVAEIRELLYRGHGVNQAVEEYRYMPPDLEDPIRWGFIGVTGGKGGSSTCVHVSTTSQDEFFDDPDCAPERVAALALAFSNPHTIAVCRHLFRGGGPTREQIMEGCGLDDAALDEAVAPLLEWRFVIWEGEQLEYRTKPGQYSLNSQGINYAITLIAITKTAFAYKDRQERK